MLKTVVLICAVSTPQDQCTQATAVDVIQGERVNTPQQCAFLGQALLAPTSVAPEPGRQYAKIVCVRDREARR